MARPNRPLSAFPVDMLCCMHLFLRVKLTQRGCCAPHAALMAGRGISCLCPELLTRIYCLPNCCRAIAELAEVDDAALLEEMNAKVR